MVTHSDIVDKIIEENIAKEDVNILVDEYNRIFDTEFDAHDFHRFAAQH